MQKGTWSVAAASALGAFLGGLTALELAQRLGMSSVLATLCALSIGALVGGFVGWCAVDFRHLMSCAGRAFKSVVAWRPNGTYWKFVLANFVFFFSVFTAWLFSFGILVFSLSSFGGEASPATPSLGKVIQFLAIASSAIGAFGAIVGSLQLNGRRNDILRDVTGTMMMLTKRVNPISVFYFIVRGTIIALKWICTTLAPNIPRWTVVAVAETARTTAIVACELWDFTRMVFVFAHSKRRTICFIAAAIGAVAGFFFGSALVGAAVGALLGAVQHEFVAVRWLKLVPVPAKA